MPMINGAIAPSAWAMGELREPATDLAVLT
jgi:hypothetical protein